MAAGDKSNNRRVDNFSKVVNPFKSSNSFSMKKLFLILLFGFLINKNVNAQRDIIYKNDSTQIRCKILRATTDKYEYVFSDSASKVFKTKILKTLVDSVNYNFYDSNLVQNKIFTKKDVCACHFRDN